MVVRMLQVVPHGEVPSGLSLPPTFRSVTQSEPFFLEVIFAGETRDCIRSLFTCALIYYNLREFEAS